MLKRPLSKGETPTTITEQHTQSVPRCYIDRKIKTIQILWNWSGLCCKTLPGGMFSLSLWISSLRLSGGEPGEEVPYPDVLKDKGRSEKRGTAITGTGYLGSLAFHTVLARFLTWACPTCGSWGTHSSPQLLHLPAYPLACTVGPQGTHTRVLKMHLL